MTYLPYIVGAYSVFGVVLAWDGLSPWLKHGRVLRAIRQRAMRAATRGRIPSTRDAATRDMR